MIRAIVVDDEAHARESLRQRLEAEGDVEVVGEAGGGRAASRLIAQVQADVVFLDVKMPDVTGLDVAAGLGKDAPYIVFVTAFDKHALAAFEANAIAYLLKPFDDVRFAEVMGQVRRILGEHSRDLDQRIARVIDEVRSSYPIRLTVRSGKKTIVVSVSDIERIEAAGDYVRLHTPNGVYLMSRTMNQMKDALDPDSFVRIHRSFIVNVNQVRQLETENNRDYTVILRSGAELRLSRSYREALEQALGDRI